MRKLICVLFILILISPALAQEIPSYKEKYVNDFANVLNVTQQDGLRELFSLVDQSTTAEMTLLTVDTVAPMAMSQYAQEVFDKWKIGKADTDNGLLILYAKQENKIWVQTGYGLEGILPDSKIGRILDETYVPERDANNTAQGILFASMEYAKVINENADEVRSGRSAATSDNFIFIVWFAIIGFSIISSIIRNMNPRCKYCRGKTEKINTTTEVVEKKGIFGKVKTTYIVETFVCKKCGKTMTKRKKRQSSIGGFVFLGGMGGGGGGGFGGGGSGGGGAGR